MWPTRLLLKTYDTLTNRQILKIYDELLQQKTFDKQNIDTYQINKLEKLLKQLKTDVDYYNQLIPHNYSNNPIDTFHNLPIMTKDIIRENSDNLIAASCRQKNNVVFDFTGGSTGQPLKFAYDKEYKDFRWALIYKNLTTAGYCLGAPHGFIYGSNFDSKKQYTFRQKLQYFLMNSFQVNAFFLNDQDLESFYYKCKSRNVETIIGYASALITFVRFLEKKKLHFNCKIVESTSEFLSNEMKQEIENALKCNVYDRYGCREVGNVAYDCREHNGLHINWESVYVEILNKGAYDWLDDDYGDITLTSLMNKGMPLVRYSIGDIGRLDYEKCSCGNPSPRLKLAGSRSGDILYNDQNGQVSPPALTLTYKDNPGIQKIQFVQQQEFLLNLNVVKSTGFTNKDLEILTERVSKVFGNKMNINVDYVDDIEKEPSGKYRFTKKLF